MAAFKSNGGYDYEFVEPPHDRYNCVICHLTCRDAHMTGECCRGQILCKPCLDQARSVFDGCPYCRKTGFTVYPNYHLDREIKCLQVYCINNGEGCEWKGELGNINAHLESSSGCQFEKIKCINNCTRMIQRQFMTIHDLNECPRRKVFCQYCYDTGEHQFIEGNHKENCPKFPLPCPNKCEIGTIPREDLRKHRSECQFEVIKCSNCCRKELERQYLTIHVETECPLRKVSCHHCHYKGKQKYIEGEHKNECLKFPLPCPNKCEIEMVPRKDMEAHREKCPLEMIQCRYYHVGCGAMMARGDQEKHNKEKVEEHLMMTTQKLRATEDRLTEHVKKMDQLMMTTEKLAESTEKLLATNDHLVKVLQQNKVLGENLTVLLYDHMHDDARHLSVHNQSSSWFNWATIRANPNTSATSSSEIKYDNTIIASKAHQTVKLIIGDITFKSCNQICPVIFKMPEFCSNKEGTWFSDSFYTHDRGYKMCLRVCPNGFHSGKGTHMSWYLYLMKGLYDHELTWPLKGLEFQVTLLNQINDSEHRSLAVTFDNKVPLEYTSKVTVSKKAAVGWGQHQFIPNEKFYNATTSCQYLKDDCVFFRVSVTKL